MAEIKYRVCPRPFKRPREARQVRDGYGTGMGRVWDGYGTVKGWDRVWDGTGSSTIGSRSKIWRTCNVFHSFTDEKSESSVIV